MSSIEEQFKAMPPITRGWLVAALITTFACVMGLANPGQLYLDWSLVVNSFHLWRLATCFIFFGKPSMGFAFQLWIMVRMCYRYEENPFPVGTHTVFGRSSADMAMMLIFGALMQTLIGYFMGLPFMGPMLVFMGLYVWSRRNEDLPMSIFGIKLTGFQYPWAMLALSVLMGNSPVPDLIGIFTGHIFYFLVEVGPNKYAETWPKWAMMQTPTFLFDMFEERMVHPGAGANRGAAPAPRGFGAFAGRGQTLGSD